MLGKGLRTGGGTFFASNALIFAWLHKEMKQHGMLQLCCLLIGLWLKRRGR